MKAPKGQVFLPTTDKEFDALVKAVVKKFKLKNSDHAGAVIANRIMHLPPDNATTTLEYLGACVLKNIAFQVAQNRGRGIQHRMEVDDLAATLTADPLNHEARDKLEGAAAAGSEYAKKALKTICPPQPHEAALAPVPDESTQVQER